MAPTHRQTAGLWSVRRHIVAVVLTGLDVFAAAAVLLWLAVGLPAAPSPDTRLNIIKIALSVAAGLWRWWSPTASNGSARWPRHASASRS